MREVEAASLMRLYIVCLPWLLSQTRPVISMSACPALYLLSGEQQSKLCKMAAEFVGTWYGL